jgi:hypothetical protein
MYQGSDFLNVFYYIYINQRYIMCIQYHFTFHELKSIGGMYAIQGSFR